LKNTYEFYGFFGGAEGLLITGALLLLLFEGIFLITFDVALTGVDVPF
jgi:hypothetical protein